MGSNAYLDAVEAELGRLTRRERENVRRELAAHLEDHAETLRAIGCTEDEADERATDAMGDPAETGRAIAKLYRPFWLWAERVAAAFAAVLVLWALLGSPLLCFVCESAYARFCAPEGQEVTRLNERMTVGDDVVRIYGVKGYRPGEDCEAELWLCAYDRNPFCTVSQNIWNFTRLCAGSGEDARVLPAKISGWTGNDGAMYCRMWMPLKAADTSFTLRYERFGQAFEHTFALPEAEK